MNCQKCEYSTLNGECTIGTIIKRNCWDCEYQTPNGECKIGTIEHCVLETKQKEVRSMTSIKCIDDFPEVERKVKIIKEFAKKMGYTVDEYYYKTDPMWRNQKSVDAFYIELCETSDNEGNPYCWAWSMEDGKEF